MLKIVDVEVVIVDGAADTAAGMIPKTKVAKIVRTTKIERNRFIEFTPFYFVILASEGQFPTLILPGW